MPNTLWQIAFGPYSLSVDRRTLRFDLRDTRAGIVWAENLPFGWIELENRETGSLSRHDFGDCKIVSVSEKAGAQGKRILFGLDAPGGGVPVDVYVICTEREIQLTVEASRDSKTHRVMGFGLVPGLVSVPDDGASYLVLPWGDGAGFLARDVPQKSSRTFPIWQAGSVRMPFVGAVRASKEAASVADAPAGSIALITDSVYGVFRLKRHPDDSATVDVQFERDPERRRLDVRIVVLSAENHVGIARAYRDKAIGEKSHVTLRRKIRERPIVDKLIGAAWYHDVRVEGETQFKPNAETVWGGDYAPFVQLVAARPEDNPPAPEIRLLGEVVALQLEQELLGSAQNRWNTLEEQLNRIAEAQKTGGIAVSMQGAGDWAVVAVDFWVMFRQDGPRSFTLPLIATVYHDAVVTVRTLGEQRKSWPAITATHNGGFLHNLLQLTSGFYEGLASPYLPTHVEKNEEMTEKRSRHVRMHAVLSPLHRLTFSAFLTAHRFLTPDALVEEAEYSDKTRIVINRSETDDYQTPDLCLPPGGFFVRHAQMEAHDALRVGDQSFDTRAFRIRRALDNKPLEQSADVETREFLV